MSKHWDSFLSHCTVNMRIFLDHVPLCSCTLCGRFVLCGTLAVTVFKSFTPNHARRIFRWCARFSVHGIFCGLLFLFGRRIFGKSQLWAGSAIAHFHNSYPSKYGWCHQNRPSPRISGLWSSLPSILWPGQVGGCIWDHYNYILLPI